MPKIMKNKIRKIFIDENQGNHLSTYGFSKSCVVEIKHDTFKCEIVELYKDSLKEFIQELTKEYKRMS